MPGDLGRSSHKIEADTKDFDAGVDRAEGKAGRLQGAFGKLGGAGKVITGVVAGTVVGALSDFANAAAADEANALKLQVAVENSGVSWGDYSGKIDDVIAKGQELAFSDDDTRNSLAALTESTGSVEEAMARLPIAMDLARAKNISLESASKLLGKVSNENTKVLKKYGIVMEDGATATDVLAKVQQIAGGQAEAYGSTTSASVAKVKDQIGEFTEGIGASLGPAQGLIALLPGMSAGMSLAGGAVGLVSKAIKGGMIPSFLASIPATIAMMVPFAPLILIVGAIALAALALKLAWENNFGDIQGKTRAVFDFLGTAFETIKATIARVWDAIGPILQGGLSAILAPIQFIIDRVKDAIDLLRRLGILQAETNATSNVDYNQRAGERSISAAGGFEGLITRPTTFSVAENFRPEYVSVTPSGGGGTRGTPVVARFYLNRRMFAEAMAEAERSGEVRFGR